MPELSEKDRGHFQQRGWLVVRDLIDASEAAELRTEFELQAQAWAADIDTSVDDYLEVVSQWTNVWEHNARFRQQLHHPRAAKIAAELLTCETVRLFHDHLIVKPPLGGSTIPWHRDLANWPVAEPAGLSCWLALDDAPEQAGAMRYMSATHRDPETRSIDFLNESKEWGEREQEAVSIPLRAGDAVFHHCLTWHSSPPNRTDHWRRAYITIYLDARCTFSPERAGWHPMSDRVSVPSGAIFNADKFPLLGVLKKQ